MENKKKILILLGSPRKKGNSAILAKQVQDGARAKGAEVESLYLHGMNIQPCNGCGKCQKENSEGCIIDDDMQTLYPKLQQSDAIVIASPIYWFNVSAQTKLFIDRWYAVGVSPKNIFAGKSMGILLAYADPDPFVSGAVNALRTFQDICRYLDAKIVGMVYGSASDAGEIQNNRDLMKQAYQFGELLGSGTSCRVGEA